ncbi:hypothetical protein ANTQUA_LOCUS8452 [Anthophora quadrimaculata]
MVRINELRDLRNRIIIFPMACTLSLRNLVQSSGRSRLKTGRGARFSRETPSRQKFRPSRHVHRFPHFYFT